MPLHRVWEYRDIGGLFITVGKRRAIKGEVEIPVLMRVLVLHLLRHEQDHPPGRGATPNSSC